MDELCKTHTGPVTMLNLLHFNHPDGKKSYFNYGQAFIPVAGKRGGDAKIVGNVVRPAEGAGDSRGPNARPGEEWWNEISIVHYPSIRHFCDMLAGDDYQRINEEHRLSVSFVFSLFSVAWFDFMLIVNRRCGIHSCFARLSLMWSVLRARSCE
jgi:hypothetical protein